MGHQSGTGGGGGGGGDTIIILEGIKNLRSKLR